jgi:hypothetical protein
LDNEINRCMDEASKEISKRLDEQFIWNLELDVLIKLFRLSKEELLKRWFTIHY